MRIGVMLRHLGRQPGGTGTYTEQILRQMLRLDRRNEYLLIYDDPARLHAFGDQPNVQEVVVRSRLKILWDQLFVPWLAWRRHLDVVFNPKLSVPLLAGCATVFVQHGADWFAMPEQYELFDRLYFTFFARLYWKKSAGIISVSNDAEQRLAPLMGPVTAAKMHTIHHGVDERFTATPDPAAVETLKRKYGLEQPFILYLGQIYPMKNVGGLLKAYATLRDRISHPLVLVGKAGVNSDADLALIDSLGLRDRVRHIGWVENEEVPLFYSAAEVFAFPSIYEGFGIPIIEAMASGCPVLTSTGGSCPEVAGDAALLVDPHDTAAIAAGIERLLGDHALRDELRRKGLERARLFTWEKAAAKTIDLLESVARKD